MNAHKELFEKTVLGLAPKRILDAGSGQTSLSILCEMFPRADMDAVIFPGDERKKNSVLRVGAECRFRLIETDIAKTDFTSEYDLIVAHLLLGEAVKWGNDVPTLLAKLFAAASRHVMIADFPEDPEIDFDMIDNFARENGFEVSKSVAVPCDPPFVCEEFTGNFYRSILLERISEAFDTRM